MTEQREHAPVLVIFAGLMLVLLLAALGSTIVATALPTIVGTSAGSSTSRGSRARICSRRRR